MIVLDTPPARNARDFLDAPARLESFLEGRTLKTLLRPTGIGVRMLALGTAPLFSALKRVTGIDLAGDLRTFFALLGDMTEGFSARARQVDALLHAPETAFLVITSPETHPIDEAIWFRRSLAEGGLQFTGTIVNRVHPGLESGEVPLDLSPALRAKVTDGVGEYLVLADRDAANIARLREQLGDAPMLLIDELDADVHNVQGLLAVQAALFGS